MKIVVDQESRVWVKNKTNWYFFDRILDRFEVAQEFHNPEDNPLPGDTVIFEE